MANKINFDQPFQNQPLQNQPLQKPVIAPVKTVTQAPAPVQKDGLVVLRDLADSSGKALGYDTATKSVMTPGGNYTTDQLKSMGGVLQDGRWLMNENVAKNLLGMNQPVTQAPVQNMVNDKNVLMDMLSKWEQGFVTSQTAGLEQNRDADIAAIKSTLDQAVLDGKLSVREAEKQFEDQKASVEGKAYQDAEGTALYGEEMGIKNSQQMLGIKGSDNARNNSLINSNIKDRDGKILNIQDRIKSLQNKAKIDVDLAESKFRAGVTGVKGEAQMKTSEKQYDFLSKDYFVNKEQGFKTDEREAEQKYNTGEREDSQKYNTSERLSEQTWKSQEATDERFWKSTEERLSREHAITLQGNEFTHDFEITKERFSQDITKMKKQFGYDSALIDKRTAANKSEYEAQMKTAYEYEQKAASADIYREYKKYNNPNSIEYRTYKAQRENELADKLNEVYRGTIGQSIIDMELSKIPEYSQADIDGVKAGMSWLDKYSFATDTALQSIFDTTKDNIKSGVSASSTYAQVKGLGGSGVKNNDIQAIIDRMYQDKEYVDTYDNLLNMFEKGISLSSSKYTKPTPSIPNTK